MTQWKGKSRGSVLGYKIFIFCMQHLGIGAAYLVLRFVAFYFLLFSPQGTKAIYAYFHRRRGHSYLSAFYQVYRNYYKFGQTIIDKIAIGLGLVDKFTYEFDGIEHLQELLAKKQGGILISAHIGNFESAGSFFKELDVNAQINIAVADQERQEIKEYLGEVVAKSRLRYIIIKEDMTHIFDMHNALSRNEIICFTGDRFAAGNKTLEAAFLGKKARFPAGPFVLATRLNVPVIFVYVMKETNKHYHLYARTVEVKKRNPQDLLEKYIKSIEGMLEKYPLQWFNYFDFWEELGSTNK